MPDWRGSARTINFIPLKGERGGGEEGLKRTFRQTKQLFFITEKVDKTHWRVVVAGPRTCQSLEAVQLEDVRFQHLNPWTAHFRRQLGADGKQPEVNKTPQMSSGDGRRRQTTLATQSGWELTSGTLRPASASRWSWVVLVRSGWTRDSWRSPSGTPWCPSLQLCSSQPHPLRWWTAQRGPLEGDKNNNTSTLNILRSGTIVATVRNKTTTFIGDAGTSTVQYLQIISGCSYVAIHLLTAILVATRHWKNVLRTHKIITFIKILEREMPPPKLILILLTTFSVRVALFYVLAQLASRLTTLPLIPSRCPNDTTTFSSWCFRTRSRG